MRLDCTFCVVREWQPTDRRSLLRHADDAAVARNLTSRFPHPYTEADADAWLTHATTQGPVTHWAIDVGGDAVGGIGFERGALEHSKSARFGYWLSRAFWGRGIMTAAVRATVAHVFDTFDLERLEAPVFAWNPASMRVLEKCGFEREGVLRRSIFKEGQLIDAVLYARLRQPPSTAA
jgi:RimJ/RimL family protein N-acetyltransferase